MSDKIYDVIIIGYGPTGATLANLLGQAGHSVAIAEIHPDVFPQPRAINIDQEVLRTWQRIGLADEIAAGCKPHPGTDFLGADGKLIKYLYSAPPPYPLGWPANLMFTQPEAEKTLRKGLRRFPHVTEFVSHEAKTFAQDDEGVTVTLQGPDGLKTIRGRWLVGCDGANSPVRSSIGVGQEDLGFSEWWVVVDAWVRKETPLPPRTTQYCLPEAPGAYVVCSGDLRRWEMKVLAGEDPSDYRDLQTVKKRLAHYVDPEALEFWRTAAYHFHAKVTDTWRDRRILLAGDAAHQMPPFLGQGLCSGVRDAGGLWWRLVRILRGLSPESLLDSYEIERKPHIRVLTEITKSLGQIVGETNPGKARERDARLRAEMESGRMETVRQNLIPSLKSGFLDADDQTGLAGTLSVQPLLASHGVSTLADEISGRGMVLLTLDAVSAHVTRRFEELGGRIIGIGPEELEDAQGIFGAFAAKHAVRSIIVRPDSYIWGAQVNSAALETAVERLTGALISQN